MGQPRLFFHRYDEHTNGVCLRPLFTPPPQRHVPRVAARVSPAPVLGSAGFESVGQAAENGDESRVSELHGVDLTELIASDSCDGVLGMAGLYPSWGLMPIIRRLL